MKKLICALLAAALILALGAGALAETRLGEVQMEYEDYDDNHVNQTEDDEAVLQEIEDMLRRAKKNPGELDGCTMNCTLLCTTKDGEIFDFAVATDGCAFIMERSTEQVYQLSEEDLNRLWEIFDLVYETMGFDAAMLLEL